MEALDSQFFLLKKAFTFVVKDHFACFWQGSRVSVSLDKVVAW
jgi:hypothetical protein